MTTTVVTSGNVVSGAVLNNNDLEQVTQAGSAVDTTVNSGGELDVFGHRGVPGTASSTTINDGGLVDDSAGALLDTAVNAGGALTVENNATASTTVVSGALATMVVINNSVVTGTTVQSGAVLTVSATGSATGTTLSAGGLLLVNGNSATAGGTTVSSGGVGSAAAGGTITGATILGGGLVDIANGGVDIGNVVSSGGTETIEGAASGTVISDGGQQVVSSGGVASGVQVTSGGTQVISSGGIGVVTNVLSGGLVVVSAAGSSLSAVIGYGGSETVSSGGLAFSGTVSGGGLVTVGAGGSAISLFANSGTIDLQSGASANAITVYDNGLLLVEAGAAATGGVLAISGTVDTFGLVSGLTQTAGLLKVESGATATGTLLQGGTVTVMSGGAGSGTIQTGGVENILAGGTETGAAVGGGVERVYGVASAATIYYGGSQVVSGQTVSTVLSGGFEQVASGAVVSGTQVFTGTEQILSGGSSISAVFSMGGQDIQAGGVAIGAVISAAGQSVHGLALGTVVSTGVQTVYNLASGTTILAGGIEYVSAGGVASSTSATGQVLVLTGGSTVSANIGSGGVETVYGGGQGLATTIGSGGVGSAAGGTFSGAIVQSGASLVVSGNGVASGTTLLSGGALSILSGGLAVGGTISGGNETVFSGGIDRSDTVLTGAVLTVASSGVASGTVVMTGGSQAVLLSGTASGALLSGGTQYVSSAGIARATSVFAGGDQEVQGGAQVSGTAVSSGGVQTVNSGGVASATTVFDGGMEVIGSAGLALNAVVSSGGTLLVSSGATATGTLLSAGGAMVNHGSTSATSGAAVSGVGGGAIVDNDGFILGASLSTGIGISVAGGTVTNAGTIIGLSGTAIAFGGTTTNRLVVTSASVISGLVSATGAAANTLELSGSTGPGGATLSHYTAQYLGFQTLQVDAGSTWEVSGTNAVGALINDGTLSVATGDVTSVGNVSGAGDILVSGTGVLSIGGSVSAGQTVTFGGISAKVVVGDAADFAGTVANFARGDDIDLTGVAYAGATATMSGNTITVVGANASTYTITLAAPITTSDLRLSADAGNHLQITLAPQLTEALGNDTGISSTDTITSNPTLVGQTDAGASIVLSEGGTVLGSTTSDIAGQYSFTPSLADGVHTVTATVTDANGFTTTRTSTFTLDTTPPAAPTVALTAGTDSGIVGDGITNVAAPSLAGSGETGDSVVLTEGNTVLGSTTVVNGSWTIPFSSPLADGSHTVLATQTDLAGNSSSATTTLVIDTTAPAAPAIGLAVASDSGTVGDGETNVTIPAITGVGTAGDTIALYDNGALVGSGTVDNTGHFSVAPTTALADGVHPLTAVESDPAANASPASAVFNLTVDTVADAAPGGLALAPASDSGVQGDNRTNVAQPAITGSGVNGDTVALYDGATLVGTGTVANGVFSVTPTTALTVGSHTLTATQTDAAANVSVASAPYTLTVTGVPATPAAPVLAIASDSGVQGDDVTNVTLPTLIGTSAPGDTITLYEGGTVLGTATAAGDGTYAIPIGTALADGVHTLTVTDTDTSGSVSAASPALSLTIDTSPDAAPSALMLDPASDSGTPGDDLTNVTRPTIDGTGTVDDTVLLLEGSAVLGTATVDGSGHFAVTPTSAITDGVHSFTTQLVDAAGNASAASAPLAVNIETALPATPNAPTLDPGSDSGSGSGSTNVNAPVIDGTGIAGDTITLYDGSTVVGAGTVDGSGNYAVAITTLADGAHMLVARQTDGVGNQSAPSLALDLVIDTVPPLAPVLALAPASDSGASSSDRDTNVNQPIITGTAESGAVVTLYDGTTRIGTAVAAGGMFTIMPSAALSDGVHVLRALARDAASNVSFPSTSLSITIDTIADAAPNQLALAAASDSGTVGDQLTNVTTPAITGQGVAGDFVTLYDGTTAVGGAIVGSGGSFSVAPVAALADGVHAFTTRQTDLAGNMSVASSVLNVTIDTAADVAPSAPALNGASDSGALGDGLTNVAQPTVVGTGVAGDTVTVQDGATLVGTGMVDGSGNYDVTLGAALSDGTHTLSVTQTDAAGNVSVASTGLALTIDTVAPAAPVPLLSPGSDSATPGDDITNVNLPAIIGTGTPGDVVSLYDGTALVGTAVTALDGTFSVVPQTALADGSHALHLTATDAAGNVSSPSGVLNVTIDTIADMAPTGLAVAAASDSGVLGDDITNNLFPAITGLGVANHVVTLFQGNTVLGTAIVGSDGRFSVVPNVALPEGVHSLTVTQTDPAGNVSAVSQALAVTIDTTADAAPTAVALLASDDSGVAGDDITNVTTPSITGTGVAGSTATLIDGNVVVASTVVGPDGTFSLQPGMALGSGIHDLTVQQVDVAGNVSAASAVLPLTIDVTPPAVSAPTLAAASDSGMLGDALTDVSTPIITGVGEVGATVTLFEGTTVLATGVVGQDGRYSITPTAPLADGVHSLTVSAQDKAGNVSAVSPAYSLTIDTVADASPGLPVLAVASDSGLVGDGLTNVAMPTITGTGVAGDTVTLLDGTAVVGTAVVAGDGTWSAVTSNLADGTHELTAVQTDAAGNVSVASAMLPITIDTVADAAPGLALAAASDSGRVGDGLTNVAMPTITGTGVAGDTVTLRDGTTVVGTAVVTGNGTWSAVTNQLVDGSHALTAVQTDAAGNVSAASVILPLTIDTLADAAPGMALAAASDSGVVGDGLTNVAAPTITGTGVAGDTVTLRDGTAVVGTATVAGDGTWSAVTNQLGDGLHELTAVQTDSAGNVSVASAMLPLIVDTVADAAPGLALAAASDSGVVGDRLTNVATPTITGTGVAGDTVTLLDGTAVVGTATVAGDGTWSAVTSHLADGVHDLTAVQTDAAGNVSTASVMLPVTIDTVADAAPGLALATASDSGAAGDGLTNVVTPTITGTGMAGDIVTVLDGTAVVGTAVVTDNGTWSAVTSQLADGVHDLTAVQTDAAGNASATSATLQVTIDTEADAAPGLALDAPDDNEFAGDELTNVATPTIVGTGVAGDIVTVLDGTTVVGTAVVAFDDTWSVVTSQLSDGLHDLTAVQTDPAGNVSAVGTMRPLTVDTVADAAPGMPVLAAVSDSGVLGDGLTNVAMPTITGTGVAGDTVTLLDGTVVVGTAVVAGDGTWSAVTSQLADGVHDLTAVQTDLAGNVSVASAMLPVTIDTVVDAAPGLALAVGSDSGVVGDGLTNVAAPTITGTGVAGDTVRLLDGGTVVGTATVAGNGTWSAVTSHLADGAHALTAVQSDAAGNVSAASVVLPLTVQTANVAVPSALMLAVASDSGVTGDGLTNVAAPTITGTGIAGDTVTLRDGAAVVGTATVAGDGTWSAVTSHLADGAHALTAVQTDAAGNVSIASAMLPVTIDTVADAAPGLALAAASDSGLVGDGLTNVAVPTITGTGMAGDTVTLRDGTAVVGTVTVAADGTWLAVTSHLADGAHALTAVQTDAAGNVSAASAMLPVTIDTVTDAPPGLALAAVSDSGVIGDGLTNVAAPTITGTGVTGDTVTLRDGTAVVGTATVAGNGTWSAVTSNLVDGLHELTAVQTDAAGSVSAASAMLPVTIDTVADAAPGLVLAAASDSGVVGDGLTNVAAPTITGTGMAGDIVTLRDGTAVVGTALVAGDGIWSAVTSHLADGLHKLTAVQTDAAGNRSAASGALPLTVQTASVAVPNALMLAVASDSGVVGDGATNVVTPTITGTGVAGDSVTLRDGTVVVGAGTVAADGTWSVTTSRLANGLHSLTARQTDLADNVSTASSPLVIRVQTTMPPAPASLALDAGSDSGVLGDGITNVVRPTIDGTGMAGDTVTLQDGTAVVGTAVVGPDGTWLVTPSQLSAGPHAITAFQTDTVGNVSMTSLPLDLTVQTATPAAPGSLALAVASDSGVVGDGVTDVVRPTIDGTGVAGDTVTLVDGVSVVGSALVASDGTWSVVTSLLSDGPHAITALQTDVAGNASGASGPLDLTVQTAHPPAPASLALDVGSDSGVPGDGITNVVRPTVTGTGVAGDTVSLLDGSAVVGTAVVGAGGAWSVTASQLSAGLHAITALQTDVAGNSSDASGALDLTVKTDLPAAPGSLALAAASDSGVLGDGITSVVDPTVTGTGVAGDTVSLLDGTAVVGTAVVGADGTWSVTASTLADGLHGLTAQQADVAGNLSGSSAALPIQVDTAVPATPTVMQTADVTGSGQPVLSGSADSGDVVAIYQDGTQVGSTVAADGSWSYAYPAALAAGGYTMTAVATNAAGTASAVSAGLAVTVADDSSYTVTVPSSTGATTQTVAYTPAGTVDRVDTTSSAGNLLTSVTNTTALINIYDTAGTLIGTIVQPSTSAFHQPVFDTTPASLAASTASGQSGSVVDLLSETNNFVSQGNDTITVHSGTAMVAAAGPTTVVHNLAANLTFYGNDSATQVYGGSGSITAIGGTAGSTLVGGTAGHNVLVAGGGTSTLVGAGDGDVLFGSDTGTDTLVGVTGNNTLVAGAGNETLVAHSGNVAFGGAGQSTLYSGADGGSILVGGTGASTLVAQGGDEAMWGGNGATTIWGGSGHDVMGGNGDVNSVTVMHGGGTTGDLFIGGAGTDTAYGSNGNDTFWSGAGAMSIYQGDGNDIVGFGTGATVVFGGAGTNLYAFIKGVSGGQDVINNFKVGTDHITLTGYDPSTVTSAVIAGSTVLTLSDNTRVTLTGITALRPDSIS